MNQNNDTIVAVSSAPGRSLRGLVRISGPGIAHILPQLLESPAFDSVRPRVVTAVALRIAAAQQNASAEKNGVGYHFSLPALLTMFRSPASFTGEDLAEIQIPGNAALLDRLVHQVVASGARIAEPGEFTFRAYLAGKLDLTQAEGIAATISATSDGQLHAAALLRDGRLGKMATAFVSDLANLLALVEAGIDFVDQEDVVPISPAALATGLADLRHRIAQLLERSRAWSSLEGLPRVVLAGPPSAGKSTLFNALLSRSRAVVDAMPGTTRDVLEEPLTLTAKDDSTQAAEVMLVDIAGLDRPQHALDHAVQDAARQALKAADLVLLISDGQPHVGEASVVDDFVPQGVPRLRVRTKSDLNKTHSTNHADAEELATKRLENAEAADIRTSHRDSIRVCALSGEGLDDLRAAIRNRLGDRAVSVSTEMLALQPRHEAALRNAADHLASSDEIVQPMRGQHALDHVELIAAGMRLALDELASLGGEMTPDDVIGRVFATFCVGK